MPASRDYRVPPIITGPLAALTSYRVQQQQYDDEETARRRQRQAATLTAGIGLGSMALGGTVGGMLAAPLAGIPGAMSTGTGIALGAGLGGMTGTTIGGAITGDMGQVNAGLSGLQNFAFNEYGRQMDNATEMARMDMNNKYRIEQIKASSEETQQRWVQDRGFPSIAAATAEAEKAGYKGPYEYIYAREQEERQAPARAAQQATLEVQQGYLGIPTSQPSVAYQTGAIQGIRDGAKGLQGYAGEELARVAAFRQRYAQTAGGPVTPGDEEADAADMKLLRGVAGMVPGSVRTPAELRQVYEQATAAVERIRTRPLTLKQPKLPTPLDMFENGSLLPVMRPGEPPVIEGPDGKPTLNVSEMRGVWQPDPKTGKLTYEPGDKPAAPPKPPKPEKPLVPGRGVPLDQAVKDITDAEKLRLKNAMDDPDDTASVEKKIAASNKRRQYDIDVLLATYNKGLVQADVSEIVDSVGGDWRMLTQEQKAELQRLYLQLARSSLAEALAKEPTYKPNMTVEQYARELVNQDWGSR